MKNIICLSVVGAFLAMLATAFSQQSEKAEALYQEGLVQMEGRGNYNKALEIFGQIVKGFSGNRRVSAKAQFQIGVCYEKLGNTEAKKAYERVVKEFADQSSVVKEARARLIALGNGKKPEEKPAMTTRQVWTGPEVDFTGTPSPDGRYLSYVHWENGNLAVRDLVTGEKRLLTKKISWIDTSGYPLFSTFSSDGKFIAYTWARKNGFDLGVIGVDGSNARIVYQNPEVGWVHPFDWSPDGKHILAIFSRGDRTNQIVLVKVADGSARVLKTLDWRYPGKMSFSPDGSYIVYDFPPQEDSPRRDIYVLAIDGSREIPVVEHSADDFLLGWAPDGKTILFGSDRTGSVAGWGISFVDGKVRGGPRLLKSDMGRTWPLGFTREGSYYYGLETGVPDVYTAEIDFETGKIVSEPFPASQSFVGSNSLPDWSPDGRYVAYISQRGPVARSSQVICIRSMQNGTVKELPPKLGYHGRIRWSPDGQSFLTRGNDLKGRQGLYQINAQTGEVTLLYQIDPGKQYFNTVQWSPDGKSIFSARNDATTNSSGIVLLDPQTGKEKELYRVESPSVVFCLTLSPDGQQIAFTVRDHTTKSQALILKVIPATGGEALELAKEIKTVNPDAFAWTADGKYVVFGKQGKDASELWRVSAKGGEAKKLHSLMKGLHSLRIHPDGRRVAFVAGEKKSEMWVMENFLPKDEITAKPAMTTRRVWAGPGVDIFGAPSPDGRFISYTDWETGDLAIRELATGTNRRLTNKGSWSESNEFAEWSVVSPDGKQVAYAWHNKEGLYDLRVIGSDGSHPHVLYRNEEVGYFKPSDWSADGKQILTVLFRNDNTNQIALISATDGSARVLKTLGWSFPEKMSLSPDGRYIVYDFPQKEDATERDIFILAADGSRETPLVQHPADDKVLGWTPDGKRVLFASDRTGTLGAWVIQVADGKPEGAPEIIKSDIGRILPLGFTRNGAFYYGPLTGMQDVYITTLDPATGKVIAPPTAITQRFVGATTDPVWSPDGKFLAYILRPAVNFGFSPTTLVIRSLESGEERKLSPAMAYLNRPHWSADGRFIMVGGRDKKGRQGIHRIDVQTGDVSPIAMVGDVSAIITGQITGRLVAPDVKAIFFVSREQAIKRDHIWVRNLETREEKELYRTVEQSSVENLTLSPDGTQLAFSFGKSGPTPLTSLMVMSTAGGTPRELLQLKDPESIAGGYDGTVEWMADGRQIIFVKRFREKGKMEELWRIPVEHGDPQNLGITMEHIHGLRVHADGKQIAFAGGQFKGEIWVMENFLPKEEKETSYQKSVKRVLSGTGWEGSGAISPDESRIAYVDYSSNWGDLIVKNVRTGASQTLVDAQGHYEEFAGYPQWSPDGKLIVYYWYLNKEPWFDLRVVSPEGGQPKVLYANREQSLFPKDWSPDASSLVCEILKADKSVALGILSVGSGELRQLLSLQWSRLAEARFSADGKFIVYEISKEGNRDLYILSVDGKHNTRLTDSPGEDSNPVWSQDGKNILFSSNRRGVWDLWGIAMRAGVPTGEPFLVQSDHGSYRKMMTASGKMFYNVGNDLSDVYSVDINSSTGNILNEPKLITRSFYGQHRVPAWSPDGKRIAYIQRGEPSLLCILSTDTGEEECIETGMRYFNRIFWSPDGKSLALSPAGKTGKNGVYLYSLEKRELWPIIEMLDFRPKGWSADGKEFVLVKQVWSPQHAKVESQQLVSVNVGTGKERMLFESHGMTETSQYDFVSSPDLRHVVFVNRDSALKEQQLVLSDINQNAKNILVTAKEPVNSIDSPRWSPDGTKIVYNFMTQRGGSLTTELRMVSADGAWDRKIETGKAVTNWTPASWSPDGSKLAFTLTEGTINELWVMENFLSRFVDSAR